MVTLILTVVLSCFIAGNCLVIREKTPNVVRVREGDTLTLEAEVDSHELNLRFTGPGNKPVGYEYDDHRAMDGYEVLNFTNTGYLFSVWLTIENIDRFQSGWYFLTGYDAYSWDQRNWTVVVQVVPLRHVSSVTSSPMCDINDDIGDLSCGKDTAGHDVYWEYMGCSVTIRYAEDAIASEFDQCEGLHETDEEEKIDLLYEAAKHGDQQQVSTLLMLGADVNGRNRSGAFYLEESALCISALMGHVQVVQLLLNSGARLHYEYGDLYFVLYSDIFIYAVLPSEHVTALGCAARSGSVTLVEMILSRSKNLPVERKGDSSFLYAAMSGSLILVKQYLSWGSDCNHTDSKGRTPIFFAALSGSLQLVEFFQGLGADVLVKDSSGSSILFYAARSGSVELVEYLVSAGLQPLEKNSDSETPIAQAVLGGSVSVLEAFIKWGGDAFYIDKRQRTLLHYATIMGHVNIVEKLVAMGLNISATENHGRTLLHFAAQYNRPSLIQTIISLGGNIEARNYMDRTPLHNAAKYANPLCVELLLRAGANVNAVDHVGDTPLLNAIVSRVTQNSDALHFDILHHEEYEHGEVPLYKTRESRRREIIVLLLKGGANANTAGLHGRTPLHYIVTWVCKREYIELLVKAGGDPNKVDRYGWTPLHVAALAGPLSCVRNLVEVGASTAAVTKNGETVLDFAKRNSRWPKVLEWLRNMGEVI